MTHSEIGESLKQESFQNCHQIFVTISDEGFTWCELPLPLIAKPNDWVRKFRQVGKQQTGTPLLFTGAWLATKLGAFQDRKQKMGKNKPISGCEY